MYSHEFFFLFSVSFDRLSYCILLYPILDTCRMFPFLSFSLSSLSYPRSWIPILILPYTILILSNVSYPLVEVVGSFSLSLFFSFKFFFELSLFPIVRFPRFLSYSILSQIPLLSLFYPIFIISYPRSLFYLSAILSYPILSKGGQPTAGV